MVEISRGLILLCFYGCWNPFRILIVARSHGAVKNFWARMTIAFAGFASDNDGAKRHQNSAAPHYFLRRTTPVEPSEPVEPAPLFHTLKGGTPKELTPNPEPRTLNLKSNRPPFDSPLHLR